MLLSGAYLARLKLVDLLEARHRLMCDFFGRCLIIRVYYLNQWNCFARDSAAILLEFTLSYLLLATVVAVAVDQ